jgi:hypothetical protein
VLASTLDPSVGHQLFESGRRADRDDPRDRLTAPRSCRNCLRHADSSNTFRMINTESTG